MALNMFKIVFDDWIDDVMNLPDDFINLLLEVIFVSKDCTHWADGIFEAFEENFKDSHNETAIRYINKIEFSDTRDDYVDNCIKLFRLLIDEFGEKYEYSYWLENALNLIDKSSSWSSKIINVFSQLFSKEKILTSSDNDITIIEIEEYPW